MKITLVRGDITQQPDIDVIVNAANPYLQGGSGVCGAIFKAAGWDALQDECSQYPLLNDDGARVPVGGSVVTGAGRLPNKHIIHAVGPVYNHYHPEIARTLLTAAYHTSLAHAARLGCKSIAFPAISCGIYGYPVTEAAYVALLTATSNPHSTLEEVRFVLFEESVFHEFQSALAGIQALNPHVSLQ